MLKSDLQAQESEMMGRVFAATVNGANTLALGIAPATPHISVDYPCSVLA